MQKFFIALFGVCKRNISGNLRRSTEYIFITFRQLHAQTALHAQTVLSERQVKVLNRLLDNQGEEFSQGVNASKYQALAKVSKATSTRGLADLVQKNCLTKLPGRGRSTRYALATTGPGRT